MTIRGRGIGVGVGRSRDDSRWGKSGWWWSGFDGKFGMGHGNSAKCWRTKLRNVGIDGVVEEERVRVGLDRRREDHRWRSWTGGGAIG